MTWLKVKVSMAIYGLYIQEGLKFSIRVIDSETEKIYACFTELLSKIDIRIKVNKFRHKSFEIVFTMSPDEENILNVP